MLHILYLCLSDWEWCTSRGLRICPENDIRTSSHDDKHIIKIVDNSEVRIKLRNIFLKLVARHASHCNGSATKRLIQNTKERSNVIVVSLLKRVVLLLEKPRYLWDVCVMHVRRCIWLRCNTIVYARLACLSLMICISSFLYDEHFCFKQRFVDWYVIQSRRRVTKYVFWSFKPLLFRKVVAVSQLQKFYLIVL